MVINEAKKTRDGQYSHAGIKNFYLFYASLDYFYHLVTIVLPVPPLFPSYKHNNPVSINYDNQKSFTKKFNNVNFHDVGEGNRNILCPELEFTGELS